MSGKTKWTKDEVDRLRVLRQTMNTEGLAAALGRSVSSVESKLYAIDAAVRRAGVPRDLPAAHGSGWGGEVDAELQRMWNDEGLSAGQIARQLHRTRNAVIGRINRLQAHGALIRRGESRSAPAVARPRRPRRRVAPAPSLATPEPALVRKPPVLAPVRQPVRPGLVEPVSLRVELQDLVQSSCRWPDGAFSEPARTFCGHQRKVRRPYCDYHAEVAARQEAPPRRQQREPAQ